MYPSSDQNLSHETDDAVYFFSNAFDPLNNWSAHKIKVWGQWFSTAEHAFHYRKYSDTAPHIASKVKNAPSPWAALQIRRKYVKEIRPDWWSNVEVEIMTEIIRAKVTQHEDVRACLLKTGDKTIVENSPWGNFWGIGADGKGQNTLGKILVQIREELRSSPQG